MVSSLLSETQHSSSLHIVDILPTRAGLVRGKLEDALYGVDGEDDRLSIESGPGNVDLKLVDMAGDQTEGEVELLLQHVQPQVEVVEDGVSTPERDLGVLSLDVLDISLHLTQDDGSYVGLEFEHSNIAVINILTGHFILLRYLLILFNLLSRFGSLDFFHIC